MLCLIFAAITSKAELSSNLRIKKEINPKTRKTISETYVNAAGDPEVASDKGYAIKTYIYNMSNQLKEERYLDAEGNSVNCAEGYSYVQYEYKLNKIVKTTYYNAAGQLAIGPQGFSIQEIVRGIRGIEKETLEYNTERQLIIRCVTEYVNEKSSNLVQSKSWFDATGQPMAGPDGYARVFYEYQKKTKTHIAYYNPDGSLFFNKKDGYAEKEQIYEKGRISEVIYRDADGELAAGPDGYARVTYTYSREGKETLSMYYNADGSFFYNSKGYCGIKQYKENRRVVDESYYWGDGIRGTCTDGYSRTTKRYTLRGQVINQSYYDEQDQLMIPQSIGYAKIKNTYNSQYLVKTEYYDDNEKPCLCPNGYAILQNKFEKKLKTETSFYDVDGKTIINNTNGYATIKYKYDKNKLCISETYFDASGASKSINGEAEELRYKWNENKQKISTSYWKEGQPVTCSKGYHEIKTEYVGKLVKEQSYYNIDGSLIVNADGYARTVKLYNSKGIEMSVLFYNERDELILAPGKEYAYVMTMTAQDRKALVEGAELQETNGLERNDFSATKYIEYYGTDRKLMNISAGYAYVIQLTDAQGRAIREAYYDKDGQRAVLKNGYDELSREYGEGNKIIRNEFYRNGELTLHIDGYAAVDYEYDKAGNTTVKRYYNTMLEPASCKGGYEMIRKEYNEDNQVVFEGYYDHEGKPMVNNNGIYQTTYVYNEKGKLIRESFFDSEGQSMANIDGYTMIEREYDENGNKISETSYPHKEQNE